MLILQSKRDFFPLFCLLGLVFSSHPCEAGEESKPNRPNVLFLLTDDQRPDTIHALGNSLIETPNLDRLVQEGTTFTRAICANPICTPSRAEILTGASGFQNGVLDFSRQIHSDMALWPRTMKNAGYHTWYVGKWHNDGRPTERGFERTNGLYTGGGGKWWGKSDYPHLLLDSNGREVTGYRGWIFQTDDRKMQPERGIGLMPDISRTFAESAIELIKTKPEEPFFLQVNFTAPHDPLHMPPGFESKYDPESIPLPKNFLPQHPFDHGNYSGRDEKLFEWPRTPQMVRNELAVYYAVISHMDQQVGRILKALEDTGQRENTVIIFSSDHGLAVGSHGLRGKQSMYEHTINVPLIFCGPKIPRGVKRSAQCYLRDLFPTVCEICGIAVPETVTGKSLVPVLTGKKEKIYDHVYGYFRRSQRMIRNEEYKLIEYPEVKRTQLFHLPTDPFERKNLSGAPQYAKVQRDLRATLRAWQREMKDPVLVEGPEK
ncbi:MAG: sulfatase-like hydrolase/transferase [Planctomycetaceae bacterium]|nr:sulfatase-like hydrolase/transferase [Planctomycetaceae bacterium]